MSRAHTANAAWVLNFLIAHETMRQVADSQASLIDALHAVLTLEVKGHELRDRLQFSETGRVLLAQCDSAMNAALGVQS